jgi:hypothetical protein
VFACSIFSWAFIYSRSFLVSSAFFRFHRSVKCQYHIAVIAEFRGWLVWLAAKTRSPGTSGATETATSPDNAEKIRKSRKEMKKGTAPTPTFSA